jgi:hypothetical protein
MQVCYLIKRINPCLEVVIEGLGQETTREWTLQNWCLFSSIVTRRLLNIWTLVCWSTWMVTKIQKCKLAITTSQPISRSHVIWCLLPFRPLWVMAIYNWHSHNEESVLDHTAEGNWSSLHKYSSVRLAALENDQRAIATSLQSTNSDLPIVTYTHCGGLINGTFPHRTIGYVSRGPFKSCRCMFRSLIRTTSPPD